MRRLRVYAQKPRLKMPFKNSISGNLPQREGKEAANGKRQLEIRGR
jgi:hypothetical protein